MIFNTCRTIYGIKLQTALLTNSIYTPLPNTTLNEKFNIYPNHSLLGQYPKLNLFVIGIGGNSIIENNVKDLKRAKHSAVDGALFKHVPFIIRELNNDISDTERAKYRLRVIQNFNGIDYICYYGKVIQTIEYHDMIFTTNTTEDISTIGLFDTNSKPEILNPVNNNNLNLLSIPNNYILNMCKVFYSMDLDEIDEVKNAINIIYPDIENPIISEIGLCSSIDMLLDNYMEAIATQINFHIDVSLDLQAIYGNNKNINLVLELGGMEPLNSGM